MIAPDDKDWTWVTARPCPECGFDASAITGAEVADLIRANVARWQALHAEGRIRAGRPTPDRWSSLEYAAHVRDVYRRYDERLALMLEQDDPLYPNWDQDATAVADDYEGQDPGEVVTALAVEGAAIAARLDGVHGDQWARPGRRSDGSAFTIDSLSRYLVHDPVHHIWDVGG